jgi:hypothetical protein
MKLAVTQIVLGVLIVVFSCIINHVASSPESTITLTESMLADMRNIKVEASPSIYKLIIYSSTILLGLAVLGTGIAQLVKARKKQI